MENGVDLASSYWGLICIPSPNWRAPVHLTLPLHEFSDFLWSHHLWFWSYDTIKYLVSCTWLKRLSLQNLKSCIWPDVEMKSPPSIAVFLQGVILLKACADVLMPWDQGSCSLSINPFICGQMVVFGFAGRCVAYTVLSQPVLLIALNPDMNPSVSIRKGGQWCGHFIVTFKILLCNSIN